MTAAERPWDLTVGVTDTELTNAKLLADGDCRSRLMPVALAASVMFARVALVRSSEATGRRGAAIKPATNGRISRVRSCPCCCAAN